MGLGNICGQMFQIFQTFIRTPGL